MTLVAAALGPTALSVAGHSMYAAEFILLVGGGLTLLTEIAWPREGVPVVVAVSLAVLGLAVLVAGGDVRQGFVVAVLVPLASLVMAKRASPRAWVLGGAIALVPVLRASVREFADPSWWLTSPYREGQQGVSLIGSHDLLRVPATFPGPEIAGASELALAGMLFLSSMSMVSTRLARLARLLAGVFLVLATLTLSRSVIVGCAVGMAVIMMSSGIPGRLRRLVALADVGVLVFVMGPLYSGVAQDRAPLSIRLDFAREALSAWMKHPWTGIGYGQMPFVVVDPVAGPVYHAHFFPVQFLVELGPLGLIGIGLLFASLWNTVRKNAAAHGLFLALVAVISLDVGVLIYGRSAVLFWLAVGLAVAFAKGFPLPRAVVASPAHQFDLGHQGAGF